MVVKNLQCEICQLLLILLILSRIASGFSVLKGHTSSGLHLQMKKTNR